MMNFSLPPYSKKEKEESKSNTKNTSCRASLGFLWWLGGAWWVGHQPGMGFWDGIFWLFYVGRYTAQHFTAFHS